MSLNDINRLSITSVWKSFGFSSNMRCNLSSSWGCVEGGEYVSEEREGKGRRGRGMGGGGRGELQGQSRRVRRGLEEMWEREG